VHTLTGSEDGGKSGKGRKNDPVSVSAAAPAAFQPVAAEEPVLAEEPTVKTNLTAEVEICADEAIPEAESQDNASEVSE